MPELTEEQMKNKQEETKKTSNKGSEDILSKIQKRKAYYEERYAKAIELSKRDFAYARGEQWDEEILKQMKDEDGNMVKPAITQNLIRTQISYLRGNQSLNKYYFKVIPADNVRPDEVVIYDGAQLSIDQVASELTAELKKVENENDGEYELDDCFHEAVAGSGRSYIEVVTKEDENTFPRERVTYFEHRRYDQCYADPDHKRYDLSDSKDHIKISELSRAEAGAEKGKGGGAAVVS